MERRRSALRTAVVWEALQRLVGAGETDARRSLRVVDVGGGTGGFAVRIAALGHRVVVVDPSPDALASLERRAAEADVDVTAIQSEADTLLDVVERGTADLVLCHGVLEVVEQPGRALQQFAGALAQGGTLSLLAAQRSGAVLSRALAGHLAEARALLDAPGGSPSGPDGLGLGRRFDADELRSLVEGAGMAVRELRGVRVFVDHITSAVDDAESEAGGELQALELAVSDRPDFMSMATQLHVLAGKP